MKMNPILAAIAISTAVTATVPAFAQPAARAWQQGGGSWDREAFWRGAPQSTRDRINWLQQRIDRGVSDGSLDRRDARSAQRELNGIRRDSRRMCAYGGDFRSRDRDAIQARLDDLSQRLRWQRHNGSSGYGYAAPVGAAGGYRDEYTTDYDAAHYYRDDQRYQERRLAMNDEIYRGSDGRYYCKRNDGTTGLIVGAVGGGVLGNAIDGGHNRVAGTLIGGTLGALAGKAIDQSSDVRCR
jgi:hypothetical protein